MVSFVGHVSLYVPSRAEMENCVQVYERIKAPLLTLVSTGSPEQSYAALSHLHVLEMRAPMLFSNDYKHFYCQYNQPPYVKKLKLEMLTALANESNTYDIGRTILSQVSSKKIFKYPILDVND